MIILHLASLPDGSSHQEFEWKLNQKETELDLNSVLSIKSIFEVNSMSKKQYEFRGKIMFHILLKCDRCLENYTKNFCEDVHFILKRDYLGDELDIIPFTDMTCNITEFIRDMVITAIPMKSLCSKDCRGLCHICGNNLNQNSCECKKQEE